MKASKWFHAQGESDAARMRPLRKEARSQAVGCWPDFAKDYYIAGRHGLGWKYMQKRLQRGVASAKGEQP